MARYENTEVFVNIRAQKRVPFYRTVKYPEIPLSENDVYVITTVGDRLDLLAAQYYGDFSLYWIISTGNNNLQQNSLTIKPGTQIRIPADISEAITRYNILNEL